MPFVAINFEVKCFDSQKPLRFQLWIVETNERKLLKGNERVKSAKRKFSLPAGRSLKLVKNDKVLKMKSKTKQKDQFIYFPNTEN